MPSIALKWDTSQLYALKQQGLEKALTRTLKKAGGDAIRAVRAQATRDVRARKKIKGRRIREAFSLRFPRGSRVEALEWALDVRRVPIPMADYPARQTRKGVSVAINTGKRSLVRSAFLATMKSGHRGVYVREGKKRLPIRELFSSTVFDVLQDSGRAPAVLERGSEVFSSAFARLLPLEIARLKSGG